MSPVPPPAGTYIPSDDWTDDPSFDLSSSPLGTKFALPSSPSGSSSRSSRSSLSSVSSPPSNSARGKGSRLSISSLRESSGSPLRQSYTEDADRPGLVRVSQSDGAVAPRKKEKRQSAAVSENEDEDFDFPDFPEDRNGGTVKQNHKRGGTLGLTSMPQTVIGTGPKGMGTITRLGGPSKPSTSIVGSTVISAHTLKAKALAIGKSWEGDIDFGDEDDDDDDNDIVFEDVGGVKAGNAGGSGTITLKRPPSTTNAIKRSTLSPPKRKTMPGPDALDDIDLDLDFEDEDQDQATLKAGATIKALLPPPKGSKAGNQHARDDGKSTGGGVRGTITKKDLQTVAKKHAAPDDDDMADLGLEADLVLPLSLTNLTLATQSRRQRRIQPRPSASTINSDWDSPSTPSTSSANPSGPSSTQRKWLHSPSSGPGLKGRYSETSGTSMSDDIETPIRKGKELPTKAGRGGEGEILVVQQLDDEEDDEDMMAGLVLPSPTFFSEKREKELNKILDQKRKPQFAHARQAELPASKPDPDGKEGDRASRAGDHSHKRSGTGDSHRTWGEESMEDGLVLDQGGKELSSARLRSQKKTRGAAGLPGGTQSAIKRKEGKDGQDKGRDWERSREAGWGKHTPLPSFQSSLEGLPGSGRGSIRERTQSSLGLSGLVGLRSHSASAGTALSGDSTRAGELLAVVETRGSSASREAPRARAQSGFAMMPPPPAPSTSTPVVSATPSKGLRHQKSHYHMPTQSPSLVRKQSLSSLHDALSHHPPQVTPGPSAGVSSNPACCSARPASSSSSIGPLLGSAAVMEIATPSSSGKERYHHSTSRLTMPTSSSRAKVRAPISSIFPRGHAERDRRVSPGDIPPGAWSGSVTNLGGRITPQSHLQTHVVRDLAKDRQVERNRQQEREREREKEREKAKQKAKEQDKHRPVQSQMTVPLTLGARVRHIKDGVLGRKRNWGDGTELEGIEDLRVEDEVKPLAGSGSARTGSSGGIGLGKPNGKKSELSFPCPLNSGPISGQLHAQRRRDQSGLIYSLVDANAVTAPERPVPAKTAEGEKRKKSGGGSVSKRRVRKPAGLIKHLGTVDKKKVVGEMTWNPVALRWEGNESILRDFDAIPMSTSSTRPALITHYTGGFSTSLTGLASPRAGISSSATIRIVGDMQFDPERMCWVSIGEEEPDPFEGMADDEDDETGGGTITRSSGRKLVSVGLTSSAASNWSSRLASESGASTMSWEARATGAGVRVSEDDAFASDDAGGGGSSGQGLGGGGGRGGMVSEALWAECREAEERHRKEMKGWITSRPGGALTRDEMRERERREEKRLWEIRNLAMRS